MSGLRFYVRHADGSITDDETYPLGMTEVSGLEKDFSILGEPMTFVIEFDPPLVVKPAIDAEQARRPT